MGSIIPQTKTSKTHPLNISWILPPSMIVSSHVKRTSSPVVDPVQTKPSLKQEKRGSKHMDSNDEKEKSRPITPTIILKTSDTSKPHLSRLINVNLKAKGNLALSSLPGKQVRLDGSQVMMPNGTKKGPVARDLSSDFERISEQGVAVILNLLDDEELKLLNTPWESYKEKADEAGLEVIRYPIREGFSPEDVKSFDADVIAKLSAYTHQSGVNILVHCRGGIGRAGLIACCWLLRNGFCSSAAKAISYVRLKRSPRAIETIMQEQFIAEYAKFCKAK